MSEKQYRDISPDQIQQMLADHLRWLETDEGSPADFSNANLRSWDFRGAVLTKANFEGANLARVLLAEA